MLLDRLCNPIKAMIYRYVHQWYLKVLNQNYYDVIGKYWDDSCDYFYRPESDEDEHGKSESLIMLNFRELIDEDEYTDELLIYKYLTDKQRTYKLSTNYVYASVWWPKKIYKTHKRVKRNKNDLFN